MFYDGSHFALDPLFLELKINFIYMYIPSKQKTLKSDDEQ